MINEQWVLSEIRRTLQVLASPAEDQLSYVQSLGPVGNDEMALEFDDVAPAALSLRGSEYITDQQAAGIEEVNKQLRTMSGRENAELWTDDAVRIAPEWARLRELAATALSQLDEQNVS